MKFSRNFWIVCLILIGCGLFAGVITTKSSAARSAQDMARRDEDLSKVFRKHELIKLDPATVPQQVKSTGQVSLVSANKTYDLVLMPNDMRARNYRAEETIEGGVRRPLANSPVRTYKGFVSGIDGALARFSIDETTFEGMIRTDEADYFVEPARRYSSAAVADDYVLYEAADVIKGTTVSCGLTLDEKVKTAVKEVASRAQVAAPLPLRVIELATEADNEYVNASGGPEAANNEILDILNVVEVVYRQELGFTLAITFQHAWATADPFNDTSQINLLNSFKDHWNANFANVPRDVTHLWSGSAVINLAGLTYVGTVCNTQSPGFAYGIHGRVTEAPQKFILSAHEIGHSLGAPAAHPDANCPGSIMASSSGPASVLTFCQESRTSISTYVNGHTSCLTAINAVTRFDFDGDLKADLAVFRSSSGLWYIFNSATGGLTAELFGQQGDLPAPEDFDGDGRADIGVFRPSTGVWYLLQSGAGFRGQQFGANGDRPVAGDYDGDKNADIAVYRPTTGAWYIFNSGNGSFTGLLFGTLGDLPAPGDYDGDGKWDVAVFRPSTGTFYILQSRDGFRAQQFGASGDRPAPADYDGDGKADFVVFRPSTGTWYMQPSTPGSGFRSKPFGSNLDAPVPADFDGDGNADIAVWRPTNGTWYILNSSAGSFGNGSFRADAFGTSGDSPAPGAYLP